MNTAGVSQRSEQPTTWKRLRFSLRGLLLTVPVVAVSILALKSASVWWGTTMFFIAATILTAAGLTALNSRGETHAESRAFWLGFCISGWVYLLVVMYGWRLPSSEREQHPRFVTAQLTVLLWDWLYTDPKIDAWTWNGSGDTRTNQSGIVDRGYPYLEDFLSVGHSIWALILAWIGGWYSLGVHLRCQRR
jgi:hypothetical protein